MVRQGIAEARQLYAGKVFGDCALKEAILLQDLQTDATGEILETGRSMDSCKAQRGPQKSLIAGFYRTSAPWKHSVSHCITRPTDLDALLDKTETVKGFLPARAEPVAVRVLRLVWGGQAIV